MSSSRVPRRVAGALLPTLVAALLVPLAAAPAYACSCVGLTLPARAERADAVFTGTVTDRSGPEIGPDGVWSSTDPVTYTVDVDGVYKGRLVAETEWVVSSALGASCGLEVKVDRRYAFFPSFGADGSLSEPAPGQLVGSLCDGTTAVNPRVLDELQAALGPPGPTRPTGVDAPAPDALAADLGSMLYLGAFAWLVTILG